MIPKACTLTVRGRLRQRSRFARLRRDVETVERDPTELTVTFAPGVDPGLLAETIAVERECCSFLDIQLDERVLRIGSDDPHDLDPFEALVR